MTSPSPSFTMISDLEAKSYYAGLPSSPRLLARTSTNPWKKPSGPEAYRKLKQLSTVANHKLNQVWEDDLAFEIHACLDNMAIRWTTTDIVRIGFVGEESPAPIILWIGVAPEPSLSTGMADTAASRCLEILKKFHIFDVEVEIRESSFFRLAGPKLLPPVLNTNPTAAVRHPLSHTLGLSISAASMPFRAGTGGFYMAGDSNTDAPLLLITARHILLPQPEPNFVHDDFLAMKNDKFERKNNSQPRYNVQLLGENAYERCLAAIQKKIQDHEIMTRYWESQLHSLDDEDEDAEAERQAAQDGLRAAGNAITPLGVFCNTVERQWANQSDRILGHVVFSPPLRLGAGKEGYTEDYAIIEVDKAKIDWTRFKGNVLDLGEKISVTEFTEKMYPNPKNATSFKYPPNRLLTLQGIIPENEMRKPTSFDKNDEPSMIVIKDGSTSSITIGRASGIVSYVREYVNGRSETSKEWAIQGYDQKSGAFSDKGDSGAVIVDGCGRMGGLLTGGCGLTASSDITYATPMFFLLKSIRANGYPNAHFNPVAVV